MSDEKMAARITDLKEKLAVAYERVAEMQYEAGIYQAIYETAEKTIDTLESNARVQANLLADTGRELARARKALEKIVDLMDSEAGEPLDEAIQIAQAALTDDIGRE